MTRRRIVNDVSGKLFGPILKGLSVLVVNYRRFDKTFGPSSRV